MYSNNSFTSGGDLGDSPIDALPIEAPQEVITHLKPDVPPGVEVIGMEEGPQDFVRLRWEKDNRRGWTLINPTESKEVAIYSNTLFVHLGEKETFKGGAQPWMQVKFGPGKMEVLRHGKEEAYAMKYPGTSEVLAAMVEGKTDYTLSLTFTNGEVKVFDMKPYLDIGVFRALKDPGLFKSVKPFLGSIQWQNELDLCPDTLYEGSI